MMDKLSQDIAFTRENAGFRYRAAAIILENGRVLMAGNARDDYFYSIGGAVKLGETAEEACLREVFEETGVKFEIDRLLFIHENFFRSGDNQTAMHELTFYFLMKARKHGEFRLGTTMGFKESLHWLPLADYAEYKAYPTFFAEKLQDLPQSIERIVTYE